MRWSGVHNGGVKEWNYIFYLVCLNVWFFNTNIGITRGNLPEKWRDSEIEAQINTWYFSLCLFVPLIRRSLHFLVGVFPFYSYYCAISISVLSVSTVSDYFKLIQIFDHFKLDWVEVFIACPLLIWCLRINKWLKMTKKFLILKDNWTFVRDRVFLSNLTTLMRMGLNPLLPKPTLIILWLINYKQRHFLGIGVKIS